MAEDDSLRAEARWRDEADPLRGFRDRFYHTEGRIYLDGNSLGLLCKDAEAAVLRVLAEWRDLGIEGWTEGSPPWFFLAEELGKQVAPLVGAEPGSVVVTGSTTVNLHQLLATLYRPDRNCTRILADALAFPSDIYALQSHLRLRGLDPETHLIKIPSRDGWTLDEDEIIAHLTPDVQMAVLPAVVYTSGQLWDLERVTRAARERGVLIGWDCSHSIGAVPHQMDAWGADFAFWCHYKHLNAGPGAVGGLYLNRRHWGKAPGLAGWFSSDKARQFDMAHTLTPAPDAGALQIGTPHVLSMAPLAGTLALYQEAGIERIRAKSLALTAFLRRCMEVMLAEYGFTFATPTEDHRRGGHLALVHPDAVRLCKALRRADVVPDHRPPDIIRLAPVAPYTSFAECYEAVRRLRTILEMGAQEEHEERRDLIP